MFVGKTVGSQVRVNTYTAYNQQRPRAIRRPDGTYIVTWHSDIQDGSSWGCYFQRYSAVGTPIGSETRANTLTTNHQLYCAAAAFPDNRFVVTWQSFNQDYTSTYGIYSQQYNSNGVAIGSEFKVNTYVIDQQEHPTLAVLSDSSVDRKSVV